MEDVLDTYEKPLSAREPVICLDEQPYQLLDDTRPSEPAKPGRVGKQDYEYRRCGTCSLFVAVEPKAGKRHVVARRQRRRADSRLGASLGPGDERRRDHALREHRLR